MLDEHPQPVRSRISTPTGFTPELLLRRGGVQRVLQLRLQGLQLLAQVPPMLLGLGTGYLLQLQVLLKLGQLCLQLTDLLLSLVLLGRLLFNPERGGVPQSSPADSWIFAVSFITTNSNTHTGGNFDLKSKPEGLVNPDRRKAGRQATSTASPPGQSGLQLLLLFGQLGAKLGDLGLQLGDLVTQLRGVAFQLAAVLLQLLPQLLLLAQTV